MADETGVVGPDDERDEEMVNEDWYGDLEDDLPVRPRFPLEESELAGDREDD